MAAVQADVRSDEWYTQARYIEAARTVLGGIDLDPASSALANEVVKAERYYTKLQNGLALPWSGRVWLNPPFGRKNAPPTGFGGGKSIMGLFVEKLVEEYELGHVTAAIALVTSKTDARWFQFLSPYPLCFANHRVLFNRPGRPREGHFYGTVFAYLGPDIDLFTQVFSQFGSVYHRVAPAKLVLGADTQQEASHDLVGLSPLKLPGSTTSASLNTLKNVDRKRLLYGDRPWWECEA